MSRPDHKKNISTLVRAFGECRPLRDIANLVLIMVSCPPPRHTHTLPTCALALAMVSRGVLGQP